MGDLIQFAILGLGAGAVYSLLAQGLVLIYRGSGILNFAQGAMAMVGALVYVELREDHAWSFPAAFAVAVLLVAVIGALTHLLVMRPLRHASPLARLIATLGVLIILTSGASIIFGAGFRIVTPFFVQKFWTFSVAGSSVTVGADRLILLGIAVVMTLILWAVSKFTIWGLATSAVAENERAAAALGWSPDVIATVTWAAGGAVAAAAGIMVVPLTGLNITTMTLLVIVAMAAGLVGGFQSFPLALLGGVTLGVLQSELANKVTQQGIGQALPFLAIVLILVVRGKALPLRSHVLEHLPRIGNGIIRIKILLPVVAVVTVLLASGFFNEEWTLAIINSLIAAIVLLSVVVLTGYAGQLSLAQFALAGVGAFIAGRLIDAHGWGFEVALVAGVLGTIPVGLVFAVPALRTRGVNLAVVTLGLGYAIQQVLFDNSKYTGGIEGTDIGTLRFFGIDLNSIEHPGRFAIFAMVMFTIAALGVANLRRGRAGRRLIAVRGNERAAASLGISVFGAKMHAFALSAGIAALGGVVFAYQHQFVSYSQFDPLKSIYSVAFAVIGGVGFVVGPLFGSVMTAGGIGTAIGDTLDLIHSIEAVSLLGGFFVIILLVRDPNGMVDGFLQRGVKMRERAAKRRAASAASAVSAAPPAPVAEPSVAAPPVLGRTVTEVEVQRVAPRHLAVEDLTVRFGGVVALDGVGLDVAPGTVVGLIGPNGAGKTTLIDAVTGYVKPSQGRIRLDDQTINRWAAHRRARAGICRSWQSLELFDDLTVRENLLAACEPRDFWAYLTSLFWTRKAKLSPTALAAVQECGLTDELDRYPPELSYGSRRLLGVARSVATASSVLLLDEPAAGLSDEERRELEGLIRRLAEKWGLGVLLIEHDVDVVMSVCDTIVVLDFGKLIASGPPSEIRQSPAVIAAYLGEPNEPAEAPESPEVTVGLST